MTPNPAAPDTPRRVGVPICDIWATPGEKRVSQALWGEDFVPYARDGDFIYGHGHRGYFGWVLASALGQAVPSNARVSARGTFLYAAPDLKSAVLARLPFGALVATGAARGRFVVADGGFVFADHLAHQPAHDFVAIAESLLGVPYLWGGRSELGLDCSGLVHVALAAAQIAAPRDSDFQRAMGQPCTAPYRRGDLVCWQGHIGIMQSPRQLLHANAHSMSVQSEPLEMAATRIAANGGGDVTAVRRLGQDSGSTK